MTPAPSPPPGVKLSRVRAADASGCHVENGKGGFREKGRAAARKARGTDIKFWARIAVRETFWRAVGLRSFFFSLPPSPFSSSLFSSLYSIQVCTYHRRARALPFVLLHLSPTCYYKSHVFYPSLLPPLSFSLFQLGHTRASFFSFAAYLIVPPLSSLDFFLFLHAASLSLVPCPSSRAFLAFSFALRFSPPRPFV